LIKYQSAILFLLTTQLTGLTLLGQSPFFRHYSVQEGLPFIQVNCIFQDSTGRLLVGGYGGLSSYDGYDFVNFGPEEGLKSTWVKCINQIQVNEWLIGTNDGLYVYDQETFRRDTLDDSDPNLSVNAIVYHNGKLWLGTDNGIWTGSSGDWNHLENSEMFKVLDIVYYDSVYWAATDMGLFITDGDSWDCLKNTHDTQVFDLETDRDALYIASEKGLAEILFASSTVEYANDPLLTIPARNLKIDHRGILWLATSIGLIRRANQESQIVNIEKNIGANNIECLYVDREKNLWVGTHFGLYKTGSTSFLNLGKPEAVPGSFIFQITQDSKGNYWIGTKNHGGYKYDGLSFYSSLFKGLEPFRTVHAIQEWNQKIVYGTENGLRFLSKEDETELTSVDGIRINNIYSMNQSPEGKLWAGGDNAVYLIDDTIKRFEVGLETDHQVWSLASVSDKELWVGIFQGGLYCKSGDQIFNYGKAIGMEVNNVLAILPDRDRYLWIGTFNGVYHINLADSSYSRLGVKDGLSSNLVYSLTFNKDSTALWVGTNQGANRIDLRRYYSIGSINIDAYGPDQGFAGVECNCNGAYCDSNGVIWFGTVDGIYQYDQKSYIRNKTEPILQILGTQIFFQDTLLKHGEELSFVDNHITFKYGAISLSNPDKTVYKYRLKGFNEEWSPESTERSCTFTNLQPGEYEVEIMAANSDGVWTSMPATFSFSIERPIWLTWWFWSLIFITLILAVYLILKARLNRFREREKLQRSIEEAKAEALRSQMNPHFIFNVLNTLQHYINSNDKKLANQHLAKISKLFRMTLEHSKHPEILLEEEVESLKLYLELEEKRFEGLFESSVQVYPDELLESAVLPPMLLQPFVENSIKHGFSNLERKGKLEIICTQNGQRLEIRIKDNGIGRVAARNRGRALPDRISRGISITESRMKVLTKMYKRKYSIKITDLYDSNGTPRGTEVFISLPNTM
jgi:ligand-binding sensor domain-containing protein/uncharacterized membrane-anchored protein YhcB (DUF1043 family)